MDDLRETLATAFTEAEKETTTETSATDVSAPVAEVATEVVEAAPVEKAESATDVSAPVEKAEDGDDKPKSIEEVVAVPVAKPAVDHNVDRAPASWKGDAKKLWAELPLTARQEVIRRERDTLKVLQESSQDRRQVASVQQVLAPHMERINRVYNGDAMMAVNNLLGIEKALIDGDTVSKAQMVARMVKEFKVDIQALDSALSGQVIPEQQQQIGQFEQILNQRLAPVMTFLERQQNQEAQQRQQIEQEAVLSVEQMASDPEFPYFDEVRDEMADIIEIGRNRGVSISLQDAYYKAVRMNDQTFESMNGRVSAQTATQAALSAHQAAQKAKGAAVSVSGNPSGIGINAGNPADLRGTIAEAFGSMGGRL